MLNTINRRMKGAFLNWLFDGRMPTMLDPEEQAAQDIVLLARQYYDGNHGVFLTDRQEAWLRLHGDSVKFSVNHCPTVVDAVTERLALTGFVGDEALTAQLWAWWKAARLDAMQSDVYLHAVRDGEAFVAVNWDTVRSAPEFILHQRFVDTSVGGDGFGMWAEYPGDNVFARPQRVVKRWGDVDERGKRRERMTVYFDDHIEKYFQQGGQWRPLELEGELWPLPWVDRSGQPLGIPVAHFKNPGLRSELKDVIPLQDALNKAWLDLLAASDSTAFRLLFTIGFIPTTDGQEPKSDGSNLLKILPGQMIGTKKKPGEADLKSIEPADLSSLLDLEQRIVHSIASITDTPLSRFQVTRQVAAEGTLKQQEAPLVAKVENRQLLFGDGWEDAMRIAVRLDNAFGNATLDAEAEIDSLWKAAATRDETEEVERAKVKKEIGVGREQLLKELGYSPEQIAAMPTPAVGAAS